MGIVLGKAPYAEKTVADAVLLVAIDGSKFGHAHRKIAVAALLCLIYLNMERAVHRLYVILFDVRVVSVALLNLHAREHTLFIETEVTGSLPEIAAADVRRIYDFVTGVIMFLTPVFLNRDTDTSALGEPMNEAGAYGFRNREELELPA